MILEDLHNVGDGGSLLADSDVDAVKLLGVLSVAVNEGALLVNDGVDSDGSLSSLSVTNNELSLASANGHLIYKLLIKDSFGAYSLLLYKWLNKKARRAVQPSQVAENT